MRGIEGIARNKGNGECLLSGLEELMSELPESWAGFSMKKNPHRRGIDARFSMSEATTLCMGKPSKIALRASFPTCIRRILTVIREKIVNNGRTASRIFQVYSLWVLFPNLQQVRVFLLTSNVQPFKAQDISSKQIPIVIERTS